MNNNSLAIGIVDYSGVLFKLSNIDPSEIGSHYLVFGKEKTESDNDRQFDFIKVSPKKDFKTILLKMCEANENHFILCSSESAIRGDITAHIIEHEADGETLIMPKVIHVLPGQRRLLQHTEFLFSIVGKIFDTEIVKELLQSHSFSNEIDFMASYYRYHSRITVLDNVYYYELSNKVIDRKLKLDDVDSFFCALRLFSDSTQRDLLKKWIKSADSRVEKERMYKLIATQMKDQTNVCNEFRMQNRIKEIIRRKIRRLKK